MRHATIGDVDFALSQEQEASRDTCRDFAREVVAPAADELDREHKFGYDIVRQMGELGLFGLPFAEEYGGANADFLSLCLAIEEISRADAGVWGPGFRRRPASAGLLLSPPHPWHRPAGTPVCEP